MTIHHTGSTRLAVTGRHALLARTQAGSINTLTILQVVAWQAGTITRCGDGYTVITTHPVLSLALITTEYQSWQTLTLAGLAGRLAVTLAGGEAGVTKWYTLITTQECGVRTHSITRCGDCNTFSITILVHHVILHHTDTAFHTQLPSLLTSSITRHPNLLAGPLTLLECVPVLPTHAEVPTQEGSQ